MVKVQYVGVLFSNGKQFDASWQGGKARARDSSSRWAAAR